MEVHIIRHTPVNFDKNRCYGQLDVPLADSFDEDVQLIKELLSDDYDTLYSSPKKRCTQLAAALDFKNVTTDERLLELNFGTWEGKLWNEIDQEALQAWMENFVSIAPTQGESLETMYARVSDFIDALRNEQFSKVLIIAHAGVIRCLWAYFLEIPLKNIFRIPVKFHEHFIFKLGSSRQMDSIIKLK
jgi:alpha-ribazole phosphatase